MIKTGDIPNFHQPGKLKHITANKINNRQMTGEKGDPFRDYLLSLFGFIEEL